MELATGVAAHLIAGGIGSVIGYTAKYCHDKLEKNVHRRNIRNFFKLSDAPIKIIHSAIFDSTRCAYNFPSRDSRSARAIARLFESVGMTEGADFSITHADAFINEKGKIDNRLWEEDLVLLCSPKRNTIVGEVLRLAPKLRYSLAYCSERQKNILTDTARNENLTSSRDRSSEESHSDEGYDFGLILNLQNPHNPSRSVTVLAGIHGAGTLGASLHISHPGNLKALIKNRKSGIIQNVIKAEYTGGNENILSTTTV